VTNEGQVELKISERKLNSLKRYLFSKRTEQAAFLFMTPERSGKLVRLSVQDTYLVREEDLVGAHEFYLELTDEAKARIIKKAWDTKTCLAEIHSHHEILGRARFSLSDLSGLQEFVPHVWWRLEGGPYLALVFNKEGFDGLVWKQNPHIPTSLSGIRVGHGVILKPTNITINSLKRKTKKDGRRKVLKTATPFRT
jgi:hypothetical protein